jgi:HAE1 family hydrophobic/amphiphilic exporter-1
VAVVFLFLGNVRSTVITGLALPNSILGAFFLIWIAGFSINITTLAALALAVGLLIDDAIVVRENIYRRIEGGEKPESAAVTGTREVTLAVTATTLTVLSVFAPVSFLQGIIGQFFKQFGLTICFAMVISLLDSLTVAPMLSAYFGAPKHGGWVQKLVAPFERAQRGGQRLYLKWLQRSTRHPFSILAAALVICAVSVVLMLWFIPKTFTPSQESGEFQVLTTVEAGSSLDFTARALQEISERIQRHPEVARVITTAGGDVGERNVGQILVLLQPPEKRHLKTSAVKDLVREDLKARPDVSAQITDLLDVGGGAGHPYQVKVTGENLENVRAVASRLIESLRHETDLKDLTETYRAGGKELRWVVDPQKAREQGASSAEVGNEIRSLITGARPARLHDLTSSGGRDYAVHVRLNPKELSFSDLLVPNMNHQMIPLTAVARRLESETPAAIEREDRKPFIEVDAELDPHGKGLAVALDKTKELFASGRLELPPGVQYEFSGQTKDFQDLLANVILAGALSILAMYLVLASLYESFFVPFSIMLVLPLAICGAFYGLWVTGSNLDIYSMIGCILLMGVAAKNSILLVDSIQAGIQSGLSSAAAITRAGEARFRPIIMTSFALIAGMLPLALPLREASRGQAPMAIAVIGGVVSSTLLTLVVVPAAYGYVARFEAWVRRLVLGSAASGSKSSKKTPN